MALLIAVSLLLSGCLSANRTGGFYRSDGPHKNIPVDLSTIPDAVPKWEPVNPSRSRPYIVLGRKYYPLADARNYRELGVASWYGKMFHGRRTALGERYDMYAMTAAHKTLPLPCYVRVRNLANGKTVVVRVNDRGPFLHNRLIDLSYAAAHRLGMLGKGTADVEVVALTPGERTAPPVGEAAIKPVEAVADSIQAEPLPPASPARSAEVATPAAAVTAAAPAGKTPVAGGFYIQVGAFGTAKNAENLRTRLERAKFRPVIVMPVQRDNRQLYRVRIGPLDTLAEGETVNRRLKDQGITGSHIVSE